MQWIRWICGLLVRWIAADKSKRSPPYIRFVLPLPQDFTIIACANLVSITCFCCYLLFFVVFLWFECLAINLDDATKEFIECMLENQDATCGISTGPLCAVPRGEHIRTKLCTSRETFLVPDIIVWDPISFFPHCVISCPLCNEHGVREDLHPIRWIDGSKMYEQPQTKPTPLREIIKTNIVEFLNQWKDVEYNGTKLIPQCALYEINKLLIHMERGCLSDIPPSGGTSRNEGQHRVLNKTLKKSRIGIQFAIALLGMFFYVWNEKQLSPEKDKKKIRVIPPIESHFTSIGKTSEGHNELFGIADHFDLSGMDGIEKGDSDVNEENTVAEIVAKVSKYLNCENDSDPSSDDEECCSGEDSSSQMQASFSESHRKKVLQSSKSMEELCSYIQSVYSI